MAQIFIPASNNDFEYEAIAGGVRLTRYLGSDIAVAIPTEYPAGSSMRVLELKDTFAGNTSVVVVFVSHGLVSLSGGVFAGCTALRDVHLPDSILMLSPNAFDGCGGITVHCGAGVAEQLHIGAIAAVSDIDITSDGANAGLFEDMRADCAPPNYDFMPEPDGLFPGVDDTHMDCGYAPAPPMPMPAPPSFTGHPQASKRESVKVTPVRCDKVSFSAISPEKVEKGTYSTISVFMYTKSQRKIVDKAIKAAKSAVAETTKSGFTVNRGADVTFELCSDDVTVKDNRITMAWYGSALDIDFMFLTPEDYSKKQIGFTCYIYFDGIQITRLNFAVSLRGDGKRVPVKVKRHDNRHVFVSYAHKDTQRVLAQLVGIQELAPKMTFWLDSQSLETGDNWRREIRRAINRADGLFLFWSVYSSASAEVEKEWRYALKRKGLSFITPVPLDPPELCPPPAELGSRHFGHRSFAYTDDMEKLNFRSSKRVKIIR